MPQFRKKPVVIEAEQFFIDKKPYPNGVTVEALTMKVLRHIADLGYSVPRIGPNQEVAFVVTIHDQRAYLNDGDWIITEPDGEHHYPCKPDIFEQTYESVLLPFPEQILEIDEHGNVMAK